MHRFTGRSAPALRPVARPRRVTVVVQLLVLTAVLLTDARLVDRLRSERAGDLAAEAGVGPAVFVPVARARHAKPVAVRIPAIGVSSTLVPLQRQRTGAVQVPKKAEQAGWYVGSAHPGDQGPTVIIGHVDSTRGPGVFHSVRTLRKGAVVVITLADKKVVRFQVTEILRVPKRQFPTTRVYGGSTPGLRLVTCGGVFDPVTRHYRDNVVVFARLMPPAPASAAPRTTSQRVQHARPPLKRNP